MSTLWRDLAYGVRVLARSPGFAVVVVLTLALGIGANTAIFSIVNAVLLRPLELPQADRLAVVWESRSDQGENYMVVSPPNYTDWRERNDVFQDMGAFDRPDFFLMRESGTIRVRGARVTASLFPTLGVQPALGRGLLPADEGPGAEPVALIGHGLWQSEFGGDPGIVGQSIRLDDGLYRVLGVMPPDFRFPPAIDLEGGSMPRRTEIWVPFTHDPYAVSRGAHFMIVVGRLADGVSLEQANQGMRALAAALEEEYPDTNESWTTRVVPFERVVIGEARTALLVLLAAVGVLLLIACVNVANLMLARAAEREREYAVRSALGAGRGDLLRHAVIESQLLALTGGAVGVALAFVTMGVLVSVAPDVPRLEEASIDPAVLGYALVISVLTGAIFGLVPALRPVTRTVADLLRTGADGRAGHSRLRQALVVAEVGLSLSLLIGGGLLFRSFLTLRSVDTGVAIEQLMTMRLTLPETSYPERSRIIAMYRELEDRINALPQVTAAGFTRDVPLAADFQGTVIEFEDIPTPPDERWLSHWTVVSPGYFQAMGIPVTSGRVFDARDQEDAPLAVVVNETIVQAYLRGRDPLGHRMDLGGLRTVVGVVGDVRLEHLDADPTPAFYGPLAQVPARSVSLVARYRGDAGAAIAAVQDEIRAVDSSLPIFDVRTMEQILAERLTQPRFSAVMLLAFSILALALAGVGIYGVISYLVARRTREIGIRIALGATPAEARELVVGQGFRLLALGVALGLVAAIASTRYLEDLLFQTTTTDPVVFAGVSAFLIVVGLVAAWVPARRAAAVQPMDALRSE